jgi:hypothetical protein
VKNVKTVGGMFLEGDANFLFLPPMQLLLQNGGCSSAG